MKSETPERVGQSELHRFRSIAFAERRGIVDPDCERHPLVRLNEILKADVTYEATSVDHPSIVLPLDEPNRGFGMSSRECDRRIENATVGLDDFFMSPQREASLHIMRARPA